MESDRESERRIKPVRPQPHLIPADEDRGYRLNVRPHMLSWKGASGMRDGTQKGNASIEECIPQICRVKAVAPQPD